jgi:hypothetical protein
VVCDRVIVLVGVAGVALVVRHRTRVVVHHVQRRVADEVTVGVLLISVRNTRAVVVRVSYAVPTT